MLLTSSRRLLPSTRVVFGVWTEFIQGTIFLKIIYSQVMWIVDCKSRIVSSAFRTAHASDYFLYIAPEIWWNKASVELNWALLEAAMIEKGSFFSHFKRLTIWQKINLKWWSSMHLPGDFNTRNLIFLPSWVILCVALQESSLRI